MAAWQIPRGHRSFRLSRRREFSDKKSRLTLNRPMRIATLAPHVGARERMEPVMVSVITIGSLVCFALAAVALPVLWRRMEFSGVDNTSVSRQWLMQHQADDRS